MRRRLQDEAAGVPDSWTLGFCPVKILACEGGVSGVCATAFSNRTPRCARPSSAGVSISAVSVAAQMIGTKRVDGDHHDVQREQAWNRVCRASNGRRSGITARERDDADEV